MDYRYFSGDKLHKTAVYDFDQIRSNWRAVIDIIVEMKAPNEPGTYTTTWRFGVGKERFCPMSITDRGELENKKSSEIFSEDFLFLSYEAGGSGSLLVTCFGFLAEHEEANSDGDQDKNERQAQEYKSHGHCGSMPGSLLPIDVNVCTGHLAGQ